MQILRIRLRTRVLQQNPNYDLTPRTGKEFKQEVEIGKSILRSFRRSLPRARITWIEGNHEFRLRKYLIQRAKELYGLSGLSVPEIFDLKRLILPTVRSLTVRSDLG